MKFKKMFRTVETHTLGHPTRTVVGGFKHIPGKTMQEKFVYMSQKENWLRRTLCFEPRGSQIMSCAILTEPCTPGTDVGVLYFEASSWLPMASTSITRYRIPITRVVARNSCFSNFFSI